MTLKDQIDSFYAYAVKQVGDHPGRLTREQLDRLYTDWLREGQASLDDDVAAIARGFQAAADGRVAPLEQVDRRIRQELGFPQGE